MSSTDALLPALRLQADDAAPDSLVLLLHGFGADARDLASLVPLLARPGRRFLLPDAPEIRATIAGGWPVQAWYDIRPVPWEAPPADLPREDPDGVRASAAALSALLAHEQSQTGVPTERVVLAGFSQGGAMSLYTGLRHGERLAGIAGLSAYLVVAETLAAEAAAENAGTPVFLAHGTVDDVVPLARAEHARDTLQARAQPLTWTTWPCAHGIHPDEAEALGVFLDEVLPRP